MGTFFTIVFIIFIISLFSPKSSTKQDIKLTTDDKQNSSTNVNKNKTIIDKSIDCKDNKNIEATHNTTKSMPNREARTTLQRQKNPSKDRIAPQVNDVSIDKHNINHERHRIITQGNKLKSNIRKSSSQREVPQWLDMERASAPCCPGISQKEIVKSLKSAVAKWPICRQGSYHVYSFFNYYPTSVKNIPDQDMANRKAVWCFKDGDVISNMNYDFILTRTLQICRDLINNTFGSNSKYLTLFCIPASTRKKNELRYKKFSEFLCASTNMINSFNYVNITKDGNPKHISYLNKLQNEISINRSFFKNKNILIFDDIITKGSSLINMAQLLESSGAIVIGAFTLGVTCHTVQGFFPIYQPIYHPIYTTRAPVDDIPDVLPF